MNCYPTCHQIPSFTEPSKTRDGTVGNVNGSPRWCCTDAKLKVNRRFPRGLVFVPENYRALRLNRLMRRGEYPCPVDIQRAHATPDIAIVAETGVGPRT